MQINNNNEGDEFSVKKLFLFILSANRKRRALVIGVIIWLLRQIRDVEQEEVWLNSNKLDGFGWELDGASRQDRLAIEGECLICEYALEVLNSVIEDLDFAY